jgi:hypothetical protein
VLLVPAFQRAASLLRRLLRSTTKVLIAFEGAHGEHLSVRLVRSNAPLASIDRATAVEAEGTALKMLISRRCSCFLDEHLRWS